MIPDLPEMPKLPGISIKSGVNLPPMPGMDRTTGMTDSRRREAEKYAAEMGTAFAYSKAQDKMMKKRAKAKGRASQRIAEKR